MPVMTPLPISAPMDRSREESRRRRQAERARGRFAGPFVFLDFDGVLNHAYWFKARGKDALGWRWENSFDRACVGRLNAIVVRSGARVVVSSSWRTGRVANWWLERKKRLGPAAVSPPEHLAHLLRRHGFNGDVIACTPILEGVPALSQAGVVGSRGREIRAWLDAHAEPAAAFVILDDEDFADVDGRLVQTDFMNGGLRDEHVAGALSMLAGGAP